MMETEHGPIVPSRTGFESGFSLDRASPSSNWAGPVVATQMHFSLALRPFRSKLCFTVYTVGSLTDSVVTLVLFTLFAGFSAHCDFRGSRPPQIVKSPGDTMNSHCDYNMANNMAMEIDPENMN